MNRLCGAVVFNTDMSDSELNDLLMGKSLAEIAVARISERMTDDCDMDALVAEELEKLHRLT